MLDNPVQLRLHFVSMNPRSIGNIVIDRHRKDLGLLGKQAHLLSDVGHFHVRFIDILSVDKNFTLDPDSLDRVQQSIQGFQESCFPAAGRPDDDRDSFIRNIKVNVSQHKLAAVINFEILDADVCLKFHVQACYFTKCFVYLLIKTLEMMLIKRIIMVRMAAEA